MFETDAHRPVQVTCYSGRSYADRPASFVWQGKQYEVNEVEKEWLEPRQKHFVVRASAKKGEKGEKRFDIRYDKREDSWSLREV
jgi:hypothetical protein